MVFRSAVVILLIILCTNGISQVLPPEDVMKKLSEQLGVLNEILLGMVSELLPVLVRIKNELERFSQIQTLTNTKIDLYKKMMFAESVANIEKFEILAVSLDRIESKLDVIGEKLKAIESTGSNKEEEKKE